jgi:hypothetical protein
MLGIIGLGVKVSFDSSLKPSSSVATAPLTIYRRKIARDWERAGNHKKSGFYRAYLDVRIPDARTHVSLSHVELRESEIAFLVFQKGSS